MCSTAGSTVCKYSRRWNASALSLMHKYWDHSNYKAICLVSSFKTKGWLFASLLLLHVLVKTKIYSLLTLHCDNMASISKRKLNTRSYEEKYSIIIFCDENPTWMRKDVAVNSTSKFDMKANTLSDIMEMLSLCWKDCPCTITFC